PSGCPPRGFGHPAADDGQGAFRAIRRLRRVDRGLEAVPAVAADGMPAIALAPLRDNEDVDHLDIGGESRSLPPWDGELAGGPADSGAPLLEPLDDLAGDHSGHFPRPVARQPAPPLPFVDPIAALEDATDSDVVEEGRVVPAARPVRSFATWIIPSLVIC